jgi:Na+/serine symporter
MPKTLRKLIGVVLIIALVLIYALVATTVAAATLGAAHWSIHLLYFLVTGLLWILPAMAIIKWMEQPDRPKA